MARIFTKLGDEAEERPGSEQELDAREKIEISYSWDLGEWGVTEL